MGNDDLPRRLPRGGPLPAWWDSYMETTAVEWLDDPGKSQTVKREAMAGLDRFNRRSGAYLQFARSAVGMLPYSLRQPRILELGAGHGELSVRMARLLRRRGCRAHIIASDISENFVANMRTSPRIRDAGVEVRRIDATQTGLPDASFDLAVFVQSLHHLEPEQVVALFSEGTRVARQLLVIDAWRHPLLLLASPAFWILGNYGSFHDGIISLRRMYSADALRYFAGQCPQPVWLDIGFMPPGYLRCVLERR